MAYKNIEIHFIIFNFFLSCFAADNINWYPSNNNFEPDKVKNDFRPYDDRNIISSRLLKPPYCQEPGKCTLLNNTTYCYGMKLQYTYTSNSFIHNLTQEEAQFQLNHWKKILNRIPKCWAVVQPFLCALFLPKCDDDMVITPSKTMCEVIQNPCKIVVNHNNWPFNCSFYRQDKCKNDVRELKFNTTGQCMNPLVATDDEFNYYEGVEGCGLQCQNPLFTDEERETIQRIIIIGSIIAFISNLFAVLTFVIDWCSTKKYPSALSIFFMNVCSLLVSIGYLYQFIPGTTKNVICYKDGILRKSEPRFQKDLLCVTNFVFVYYFFIAGIVWFVIFAYAWDLKLKAIERGTPFDKKVKGKAYYHIAAWSLPFIFTILIMAMGEVDGDSLLGVCMVGVENKMYRIVFVLGPLCCSVVGIVLLIKGVFFLLYLKFTSKDVIDSQGNSKIIVSVIRVSVFCTIMIACGGVIFTYLIYDYLKDQEWKESLKNYIVCGLRSDIENCKLEHRPWTLLVNVYLIALFVSQINMASWVVASTTLNTWIKFIKKIMNKTEEGPTTHKRHKLISRAYAKRKYLSSDGRISIGLSDTKKDPVGLNFELASLTSVHSSLSWAKALPRFIARRGALILKSGSVSSQGRNSVDSQINISLRRVSVESRRHSIDSTVSVQTVTVTKGSRTKQRNRKDKSFGKNEKRSKRTKHANKSITLKDGNACSSTSQTISELEAQVLKALNVLNAPSSPFDFEPNLNRRPAICNIEEAGLHLLEISRGLVPYETNSSNSDDGSSGIDGEDSET